MTNKNDKSADDVNLGKQKDQAAPPANRPKGKLFSTFSKILNKTKLSDKEIENLVAFLYKSGNQ